MLALYTDGLVERRARTSTPASTRSRSGWSQLQGRWTTRPERLGAAMLPDGPDDDVALLVAQVVATGTDSTVSYARPPGPHRGPRRPARRRAAVLQAWGIDPQLQE